MLVHLIMKAVIVLSDDPLQQSELKQIKSPKTGISCWNKVCKLEKVSIQILDYASSLSKPNHFRSWLNSDSTV